MSARRYWLFKSEPDAFSFDDLRACPEQTSWWDGVRNYQARNLMRDEVQVGDLVLFYHSNDKPPHVVGLAEIVASAEPDHSALDPASDYFDPRASEAKNPWVVVGVRALRALPERVTLAQLKEAPSLSDMLVVKRGQRLSVQPVSAEHFKQVCAMGGDSAPEVDP